MKISPKITKLSPKIMKLSPKITKLSPKVMKLSPKVINNKTIKKSNKMKLNIAVLAGDGI